MGMWTRRSITTKIWRGFWISGKVHWISWLSRKISIMKRNWQIQEGFPTWSHRLWRTQEEHLDCRRWGTRCGGHFSTSYQPKRSKRCESSRNTQTRNSHKPMSSFISALKLYNNHLGTVLNLLCPKPRSTSTSDRTPNKSQRKWRLSSKNYSLMGCNFRIGANKLSKW